MIALTATCVAEKPVVAVRFKIEAYKSHYSDLPSLEAQIAQDLVKALKQNVSFLDFVVDSGAADQYTLTATLAVPVPASEVATQQVFIGAELVGPNRVTLQPRWKWLKYREPLMECSDFNDSHCKIPDPQQFAAESRVLFAAANYADLVKNVLREVPILSENVKSLGPPQVGWILPFRQTEICLDRQSQFRVASTIPSPAADISATFLAEMEGPYKLTPESAVFGMLLRGESDDDDKVKKTIFLQNREATVVKAVYIVQYRRLSDGSCGGAIPPPTVGDAGQ